MIENHFIQKTQDLSKKISIDFYKKFFVFNELSSTNTMAKKLAKDGEPEGTVVISRIQKQGRGRFDRVWKSPEGGLYLSIILKPDIQLRKTTLLPFVAALAVSETVLSYGIKCAIKWPNDIRVDKKKLAGILIESDPNKDDMNFLTIGIGINLNTDLKIFSKDIKKPATSLSNEMKSNLDYHNFLKQLLIKFDKFYSLFLNKKYKLIISKWKSLSDTLDRRVKIKTPKGLIIGKAYDVDDSGFLIIKTDNKEYEKIMSGDCLYFDEL